MLTFLTWVQTILAVMLVTAIILHPAKSLGMGGFGSPAQVFGSQKGAEAGLNKITAAIAIIWIVVSLLMSSKFMGS